MASNTIMFQQYTNKHSGDCEFRVTFGRHKAAVFRRYENHFYLDVYDNKLGKTKFNGICVGLDELDFLISIRGNLDQLKSSFPQMVSAKPYFNSLVSSLLRLLFFFCMFVVFFPRINLDI